MLDMPRRVIMPLYRLVQIDMGPSTQFFGISYELASHQSVLDLPCCRVSMSTPTNKDPHQVRNTIYHRPGSSQRLQAPLPSFYVGYKSNLDESLSSKTPA